MRRWPTRPDPAVFRVINVKADAHTKLLRIRDRFGFDSIAHVVEMLTRRLA